MPGAWECDRPYPRVAELRVGIFARRFTERFPLIPVEEGGRLEDPALRENFIERIFVLKRFRESIARGRSAGELVAFHTAHKMLVMSHSEERYRELGRLVANAGPRSLDDRYRDYERRFSRHSASSRPAKNMRIP